MNRKLRNAIATLAAAFAAAVAIVPMAWAAPAPLAGLGEIVTLAPADAVTIARPNDGRYSKSAEAIRKRAHAQLCSDLLLMWETSIEAAANYENAGNSNASNSQTDQAIASYDDAKKQGCSWVK